MQGRLLLLVLFLDYISKDAVIFLDEISKIKARAENIKNDNVPVELSYRKMSVIT